MRSRRVPPFPSSGESGRFEEEAYARGYQSVAGLDEVGRGPWAGPVVAAAVIFPRGIRDPEIKDSKLLTARKREELATRIKEGAVAWGLGIVGPEEIDRINILNASLLAMSIAFKQLRPLPDYLLIDGIHKIPWEFLVENNRQQAPPEADQPLAETGNRQQGVGEGIFTPALPFQRAIKKGDRLSISIAAASIVAKVARDQMMVEFDRLYPEYGFARHKGYGSAAHLAALSHHGPAPIHRRSFRPVRDLLTRGFVNSLFANNDYTSND
ncbi:ribonuclease HII [bacterium]|nr:MAG: ribonuclease HII [bacterium]